MKGLLLKEWYMMRKYCRVYLLITLVFLAVSFVSNNNIFFSFYPCLLCGMIPVNLLSYDERSGWIRYSGTLPYTKSQIVSAKYLVGLFSLVAVWAATSIVQTIKMSLNDGFVSGGYVMTLLTMSILTAACFSVCLPLVFKFGTEKGRIVYYIMICLFCGGSAVASQFFTGKLEKEFAPNLLFIGLSLIGIGIYALSWYLSIVIYKRREV